MTLPLTLACLWVLAAALVAVLPMRLQYLPGLALLLLAVPLLVALARAHGALPVALFLFAVLSMFRRPLWGIGRHLLRRARSSRS